MGVKTIGRMELDELFVSGKAHVFTKTVTLEAGGGELKRGQLIGVSDGGAYAPISSGATPYGILCEDVDATNEVSVVVYVTGHFNSNKIIGYNEAQHYNALRSIGIYVEAAMAY